MGRSGGKSWPPGGSRAGPSGGLVGGALEALIQGKGEVKHVGLWGYMTLSNESSVWLVTRLALWKIGE